MTTVRCVSGSAADVSRATTLAAALAYAERLGWPVFPCRGKVPAVAGGRGCLDATTDLMTIAEWWRHYPEANIGVATGGRSGFWVLDIDGDEGRATLEALEREHDPLPATVRQITGGGGEHILFTCNPIRQVRNRAAIRPSLDARGDSGFIVVSPSLHPETGRAYRWRPDCHLLRKAITQAPEWLIDLVAGEPRRIECTTSPAIIVEGHWGPKPTYARAALERACERVMRACIGQQETTLNGEAFSIGRLVASGHMPSGLAFRLLEWAALQMTNAAGRRPWSRSEIREKIARAFLAAQRHPRSPEGRAA